MTAAGCLEHIWLKDECNIDRHIFNAINNMQQLEHDDDDDNEEEDEVVDEEQQEEEVDEEQVDNVEHEQEVQEEAVEEVQLVKDNKPQAISVDNSEEEDNIPANNTYDKSALNKTTNSHTNGQINGHHSSAHTNGFTNGFTNGYANGHSSALTNGHTNGYLNGHSNGHVTVLSKGHSANSFTKLRDDYHDKTIKLSGVKSTSNATTTKTTAIHNVPATKAITIPLCSVQPTSSLQQTSPQEQQLLHIPARRHSSESNKENTFLTTKKISANNCNGSSAGNLKKTSSSSSTNTNTVTQSATATIHITPAATLNTGNIVATITLPTATNGSVINDKVSSVNSNNHHSLFPDAPTTPKVIRKAPTTDASPTSVKALVKKFQLEGGEQPITPPEFATNGSKLQHHHQLKYTAQSNGSRPSLSPPSLAHSSAITIANSSRRASEPITAIHSSKKLSTTSSSAPVSLPASAAAHNYKTTCVYCVSCTNSSTNGCRHPNSSITTNNITTSLAANAQTTTTAVVAAATKTSCSSTPLSSNSTKSLINNSSSNGSLTSSSSNANASTSSSTTALLFGQQQQQHTQHLLNSHQHSHHSHHHPHHHQHHHHHHHHLHHHNGVVKSAAASANGLSLDQGIIC